MKSISFTLAVTALTLVTPLRGETLTGWYPSTVSIIQKFEGSSHVKVTNDFDLQGLSVGIVQWNVSAGSFADLIRKVGVVKSRSLAAALMPKYGNSFTKLVDLSISGNHKAAREASSKFQDMGKDDKTGLPKGIKIRPDAMIELQAWLGSEVVKKAQDDLILDLMKSTSKTAQEWKVKFGDKAPLTFPEFMFFFNVSVQGGEGTFKDGALADATKLVRGGESYVKGDLSIRREALVNYLAEWLSIEWKQAHNAKYYSDARKNADLLRANSKMFTPTQIHLLYMKYVRASVGNTPYHLPFMNRGVIDIIGQGWVNQTYFDFTKEYSARSPLNN